MLCFTDFYRNVEEDECDKNDIPTCAHGLTNTAEFFSDVC
jgi:hypothetical protein